MTTAVPVHLAQRPTPEPTMQHPATAGALVRVTFDSTVHHTEGSTVVLASGARIDSGLPDVHVAVLEPGYQPGDQAHDGTQQLFRISPPEAPAYWISASGLIVQDHEVPAELRVTRGPAAAGASEAQQ